MWYANEDRPSEISDGLCFILILRYQHNIHTEYNLL
nr:MAG TPA: hypothetical protein [Caudoviricetes sp.]